VVAANAKIFAQMISLLRPFATQIAASRTTSAAPVKP